MAPGKLYRKFLLTVIPAIIVGSCSLLDTREPEQPSQSSDDFLPPTTPESVISNLENSIAQKNIQNYIHCFADPSRTAHAFTFVPSAEAAAQYPSVLNLWTYAEEQSYMSNLISMAMPGGFSSLLLTPRSSVISADSVVYSYDYLLTFQHTQSGFPASARGNLQFTIGVDNSNWSIFRWSDFKTTTDITWSSFKGNFSN